MNDIARRTLAACMALWLSGFVFLFCCHVRNDANDACPLVKLGAHCDKAEKEKDAEKVEKQTAGPGMDCCAFIPAFFDKTRTFDSYQQAAIVPPATAVIEPRTGPVAANFAPVYPQPSIVLLKNNTFLKNHTFRI